MISIILVDDEQLFSDALEQLLNQQEGINVTKCYANPELFLADLQRDEVNVDIVLMDMNMPHIDGVRLTHHIMEANTDTKVIGLSSHYTKSLIFKMLQLGASAYLPKNVSIQKLVKTINKVYQEGFYFEEFRLNGLQSNTLKEKQQKELLFHGLTEREMDVLLLICGQFTTSEIANKLFISTKTVERHRSNLFEKTKCRNVIGLVLFAIKYQLVEKEFLE